ncbi:MAG: hypothetical protein GKR89_32570 [Candidatus Latescibacteria bacterium]|nr:hypothetical protein [Candidatus Latescibacterota bacterium]
MRLSRPENGRILLCCLGLVALALGCAVEEAEQQTTPVDGAITADSLYAINGPEDITRLADWGGPQYKIPGDLRIDSTQLEDLAGLEGLQAVGGDIIVRGNNRLASLEGLKGLQEVAGGLIVEDNDVLLRLQGLGGLEKIGGSLHLRGNQVLKGTEGLENLFFVGGGLYIEENGNLASLGGLLNLISIEDRLVLRDNPQLQQLNGLEGVARIGGEMVLGGNGAIDPAIWGALRKRVGAVRIVLTDSLYRINNPTQLRALELLGGAAFSLAGTLVVSGDQLEGLAGLEGLKAVDGHLVVEQSRRLTGLSGLSGVRRIGGSLRIEGNSVLTSLAGLAGLSQVAGNAIVKNNPHLASLGSLEGKNFKWIVGGNPLLQTEIQEQEQTPEEGVITNPLYRLASPADIKRFAQLGGASYRLEGSLLVRGDQLASLKGLEGLTAIGGSLRLEGTGALRSLAGLQRLRKIGGGLYLQQNSRLANLDGLEDLKGLGGPVVLQGNPSLKHIDGLARIKRLKKNEMVLGNNPQLDRQSTLAWRRQVGNPFTVVAETEFRLSGPADITRLRELGGGAYRLGGSLVIAGMEWANLTDLQGLEGIDGSLVIVGNKGLQSLQGLQEVKSLGGGLFIVGNPQLAELAGLRGLTSVQGRMVLSDNPQLTHLDPLGQDGLSLGDTLVLGQGLGLEGEALAQWRQKLKGGGGI